MEGERSLPQKVKMPVQHVDLEILEWRLIAGVRK